MKVWIILVLVLVLAPIVAALVYGWWRTSKSEHGVNQVRFAAGTADVSELDGEYSGRVTGYIGTWQGKTLRAGEKRGINRFKDNGTISERYPFAFYEAPAIRDKGQNVIRLDYNQPENPWWLRFIVDEMVRVGPDQYLGKVHIRPVPGLVFTMGYFTLEK